VPQVLDFMNADQEFPEIASPWHMGRHTKRPEGVPAPRRMAPRDQFHLLWVAWGLRMPSPTSLSLCATWHRRFVTPTFPPLIP